MKHAVDEGPAPVAVVGMACRFPGADDVDAFWANLLDGVDAVTAVPRERFDIDRYVTSHTGVPGRTVSAQGGFLNDAFGFDAAFFGISPAEALRMDPQQRLLLHLTWEALEAAGIRPSSLARTHAGVFIGQATTEYGESGVPAHQRDVHDVVGSRLRAITSGRLSYLLDARGPSVVLDTACSSSLVAVHSARQSLLTGECELAVAGGVNLVLTPDDAIAYSQGGMLSPGGRCRFGATDGDGFVRSDGAGVVILKRLRDAERDGDHVLAVLRGSAVTNDGRASGLLLQPSVDGQVDMIETACRSAGITPGRLDYVEAHGTGTSVGDSVELRALAAAFTGSDPDARPARPLLTGSVKTNIGHAEAAAGIAGFIKAVLIAQHGEIPASLHSADLHPLLADGELPVRLARETTRLRPAGDTALIGVSSFGLSGTNAHAVIGSYRPEPVSPPRPGPGDPDDASAPQLLVLTAKSRSSLRRAALAHAQLLETTAVDGPGLSAICATAALRRDHLPHRMWAVAQSAAEMAGHLRALAAGEDIARGGTAAERYGEPPRTVFVFPGQGSQWPGMARQLHRHCPAFRARLWECDAAVAREVGWSVVEELHADVLPREVERVQPLLWAVEVALAAAWAGLGVVPDACVGHSMGETAAAYVSGALTLRDAAAVICRRSRLMQRTAGLGGMLSVELGAQAAADATAPYGGSICVAAQNAPSATVLAGDRDALAGLARDLTARDVLCRPVKVDVASHSPLMDVVHDDVLDALADLDPSAPAVPLLSTVTAEAVSGAALDAAYWADNLRSPVRFADTAAAMARTRDSVFVEISPHPVLTGALDEILSRTDSTAIASLRRDHGGQAQLLCSLGQLFAAGARIDWRRVHPEPAVSVPLPHYSWDVAQYQHDPSPDLASPCVHRAGLRDLGLRAEDRAVSLHGTAPVPPVVYLATVLAAAREAAPEGSFFLAHAELGTEPVEIPASGDVTLCTTISPPTPDGTRHAVVEAAVGRSRPVLCATALVRESEATADADASAVLDEALARCHQYVSADTFYQVTERHGLVFGESLRSVQQLWRGEGAAVARMRRPTSASPAAWEAALQPLLAAAPAAEALAFVPRAFGRVQLSAELPEEFWSVCRLREAHGAAPAEADVTVVAEDGHVLASFTGIRLRRLRAPARTTRAARRFRLRPRHRPSAVAVPTARAQASTAPPRPDTRVDTEAAASTAQQPPASGPVRTARPLRDLAGAALGMAACDLDGRRPLSDYGLDSLMAGRIRLQLARDHGLEVTAGQLLGAHSLARLEEIAVPLPG
ncbi:beta-ketoacyl synthase N-terminal-like domain-containing protein [Streptomyces sp. NPDC006552]|uniref:type I polyketide synthase n=1 Tax=Streptomyces sp. NPDC006552 TaxID=3157179 RepID=UPI0033AA477E